MTNEIKQASRNKRLRKEIKSDNSSWAEKKQYDFYLESSERTTNVTYILNVYDNKYACLSKPFQASLYMNSWRATPLGDRLSPPALEIKMIVFGAAVLLWKL
jgi:hypothetical protein